MNNQYLDRIVFINESFLAPSDSVNLVKNRIIIGAKSYDNLVRNRSKLAKEFGAKSYEIWCEIVLKIGAKL